MSEEDGEYVGNSIFWNMPHLQKSSMRQWKKYQPCRRIVPLQNKRGNYRYLSRWYCPAVREMSRQPNSDATHNGSPIDLFQKYMDSTKALQILQDLEMLSTSPTEYTTSKARSPPHAGARLAYTTITNKCFPSQRKYKQFPEQQRHLLGVIVSINKDLVPTLKRLNLWLPCFGCVWKRYKPQKSHHTSWNTLLSSHRWRDIVLWCTARTVQKSRDYFHERKDNGQVIRWFNSNLKISVMLNRKHKCIKYSNQNKQASFIVFLPPLVI